MNSPVPAAALRHPAVELLARYRAIFCAAWEVRHELTGPKRLADETAFLPAALSLQETPAHPAPRRAAWAVCALFVIALVWATLGQIDIVAVAPGRIVVSERTKTLQPLEAGVVKRVLVKDGDTVKVGQVLVELDGTNASADGASQGAAGWMRTLVAAASVRGRKIDTVVPRPTSLSMPTSPPQKHGGD